MICCVWNPLFSVSMKYRPKLGLWSGHVWLPEELVWATKNQGLNKNVLQCSLTVHPDQTLQSKLAVNILNTSLLSLPDVDSPPCQGFWRLLLVSGLEFERWLSGCGPPLCEPDVSAGGSLIQPVQDLCDLWRTSDPPDLQTLMTFDLSAWSTFQIVLFLDRMLDHSPLPHGNTANTTATTNWRGSSSFRGSVSELFQAD